MAALRRIDVAQRKLQKRKLPLKALSQYATERPDDLDVPQSKLPELTALEKAVHAI